MKSASRTPRAPRAPKAAKGKAPPKGAPRRKDIPEDVCRVFGNSELIPCPVQAAEDDAPQEQVGASQSDDDEPVVYGRTVWGTRSIVCAKYPDYPNHRPLPDGAVMLGVVGATSTGKSHVVLELIPCYRNLSGIVICSKIPGNAPYRSIERYCRANEMRYAYASEPGDAIPTIQKMINTRPDGTFTLVIFDDFNDQNAGARSNPWNKCVNLSLAMTRNFGCHCAVMTQDYSSVSTLQRGNINVQIHFRMGNRYSVANAASDFEDQTDLPPGVYKQWYNWGPRSIQYSYLFMNKGKLFCFAPLNSRPHWIGPIDENTRPPNGDPEMPSCSAVATMAKQGRVTPETLRRMAKIIADTQGLDRVTVMRELEQRYGVKVRRTRGAYTEPIGYREGADASSSESDD
jgi:hypothetical protein